MATDIGKLIREARERHGLSQQRLARRCATSQRHVSRIERGEVSPTIKMLERLLHAMGKRLEVAVAPGLRSNQSTAELRAEFESTTAGERIAETAELSEFLTSVQPTTRGQTLSADQWRDLMAKAPAGDDLLTNSRLRD